MKRAQIIALHSFRGGAGKSNATANLAALLALAGCRVGLIDTDMQSPGIHVLFERAGYSIDLTFNDYLWDEASIREIALNVTPAPIIPLGRIYLIPASRQAGKIARVLREGVNGDMLALGIDHIVNELSLDILFLDTHPGLNKETLLAISLSQVLLLVMRPDQQDYEGTGVTLQVAGALQVPHIFILVNNVPIIFDLQQVKANVAQTYGCEVVAVVPHSEQGMSLVSGGLFVVHHPRHIVTEQYQRITQRLRALEQRRNVKVRRE